MGSIDIGRWQRYSTVQEEEYFDAVEYTAYDDLVDDLIDVLNPECVIATYDVKVTDIINVKPNFELSTTHIRLGSRRYNQENI